MDPLFLEFLDWTHLCKEVKECCLIQSSEFSQIHAQVDVYVKDLMLGSCSTKSRYNIAILCCAMQILKTTALFMVVKDLQKFGCLNSAFL